MWLIYFSRLVVVSTFLLLVAGGLVTSNEAGLAVPDWPLSYGMWLPPMVGNIFWEHGHRMIAAGVGFLTLILTIWMQLSQIPGWFKKLAWFILFTVILQGVLGGLTVIYLLPAPISIAHACLGQTFFCLTIILAYFLSSPRGEQFQKSGTDGKGKRMLVITFILLYIQLILGATVRHTGYAVVFHITAGFLILFQVMAIVLHLLKEHQNKLITGFASLLAVLTVSQIVLGLGAFIHTRMIERGDIPTTGEVIFASAHHSVGAAILGITVFLLAKVHREF